MGSRAGGEAQICSAVIPARAITRFSSDNGVVEEAELKRAGAGVGGEKAGPFS